MIKGFSRLTKEEKRQLIIDKYLIKDTLDIFESIRLSNSNIEELIDSFSENVISTFPFPYSVVPNFLIDGKEYLVPFVTEESSVVAAAAKSAKFWHERGGFKTEILGQIKTGHIHFKSNAAFKLLDSKLLKWQPKLLAAVETADKKMVLRGGGIQYIKLIDKTSNLKDYFQLELGFNTCNAMGANYINSCLEGIANELLNLVSQDLELQDFSFKIIMSILSNYSPDSAVRVWVEYSINDLDDGTLGMSSEQFARKFTEAVRIAEVDVSRAVTHNKGIFNGIDSVALACGNDWRAIEANGHAYASQHGQYKSLSHASIQHGKLFFELTLPLQVGTVGGITHLHPLAKLSFEILDNPNSDELMKIMAAAGLASNFSAIKALVTLGIQKGHMKMHLSNILMGLEATDEEKEYASKYFSDKSVSNSMVEIFLNGIRNLKPGRNI
jgi:hydroxymethylglutaryl-CoA reductase